MPNAGAMPPAASPGCGDGGEPPAHTDKGARIFLNQKPLTKIQGKDVRLFTLFHRLGREKAERQASQQHS